LVEDLIPPFALRRKAFPGGGWGDERLHFNLFPGMGRR
jgi:hypothetical protein